MIIRGVPIHRHGEGNSGLLSPAHHHRLIICIESSFIQQDASYSLSFSQPTVAVHSTAQSHRQDRLGAAFHWRPVPRPVP